MKVVAVLACRVQSERLYGKPLQLVGEKTILEHLIDQLKTVKRLDGIVLAISEGEENTPFIRIAEKLGLGYVVGDEIDVLGRLIKAGDKANADIILRATTECLYIYTKNIDEMINHHINTNADLTVCENLPEGAYVEIMSLNALEKSHDLGEERHKSELCTLYIFEHPEMFRIEKLIPPEKLRRPDIRITVDYPEDLIVVREIYGALSKPNKLIEVEEIIDFLDKHPEIKKINAHIETGKGRIWE